MKEILLYLLIFPMLVWTQEQPKVGLVLSGGGAKGFAHIGVLKELEKAGVQIDYIGGTSMGAIVGGLYASGYNANQIEEIVLKTEFSPLIQDNIPRREKPFFEKAHSEKHAISLPIKKGSIGLPLGLSKGQNVLNFLTELLAPVDNIKSFSKLPIPFYCIASNIETGDEVLLEKGSLPIALRASASFPSLLNPVEVEGTLLVDGGVVNNFPVDIMKKKDVDIIIGVNVQSNLFNKEELSSVASILGQIINFQMYKKSDEQISLVDFYIRPDILEYNVFSFEEKKTIIKEGIIAAKQYKTVFDKIAKMQKVKKQKKILDIKPKKFLLDRIIIKGNNNYTRNYILGKLLIKEGDSTSYRNISKKINTLTATKNFERIDYHFEKSFSGKKLVLNIKEDQTKSYLRLGVHYDLLYESGVLLNYNHKKLFLQNDEISFDLVVGDKIRYNLEYFIDNGLPFSYGFSNRYNIFNTPIVYNENVNKTDVRFRDFTSTIYLQTTLDKKFAFGLGLEHKNIEISSETFLTNNQETFFDNSNYFNSFAFLKLDTFDKEQFPTKGFFADIGFRWFMWSDRNNKIQDLDENAQEFNQFSQIDGSISVATSFWDKFTFQYTSEAGFTLGEEDSEVFDYRLGDYNKNYINNFRPMYGYDIGELTNQSFLRSEFLLRYRLFNKHYISGLANYARIEKNVFLDGELLKNIKSGYAIGYGLETLIGPIQLKYSWSPDNGERYWLINLGFWF